MPRRNTKDRTNDLGRRWASTTLSSPDDDDEPQDDARHNEDPSSNFSVVDNDDESSIVDVLADGDNNEEACLVDSDSEEDEGEKAPFSDSTTVAEQFERMLHHQTYSGRTTRTRNKNAEEELVSSSTANEFDGTTNNSKRSDNDDNNDNDDGECSNVELTPADCASLKFLFHCHNGGVSLEFYDILFAIIRKVSAENVVDITKLPKRETFVKSLRARIPSPQPIISEVANLQVPHFDILLQIRDLLGSFIFNDLDNLCVNVEHEHRYTKFVPTEDDQFVEMCAQDWYNETYNEYITDPAKQFLLPLIFYIDETGTEAHLLRQITRICVDNGLLSDAVFDGNGVGPVR
jgi:hypothetical protein